MPNKIIKQRSLQNISCNHCPSRHLCLPSHLMDEDGINTLDKVIQKIMIVPKKSHLYHSFDLTNNIYAVYKGSCKEYWIDGNGNECVTNFYFPGDLVGLESVSDSKHVLSVIALENSELCIIPIDDLYQLMQKKEAILKRFINITGYKMRNDRSVKMGVTAEERICDFLLNITYRMLERKISIENIPLMMSQLDISNYLGISHETVSRIFRNLQTQKIISIHRKKMHVINIAELERLGQLDYIIKMKQTKQNFIAS